MKARVKATGEFVDVEIILGVMKGNFHTNDGRHYEGCELDFSCEPDYWEKLKHQAAISTMQGILANPVLMQGYAELAKAPITSGFLNDYVLAKSVNIAHELVEKLKLENN